MKHATADATVFCTVSNRGAVVGVRFLDRSAVTSRIVSGGISSEGCMTEEDRWPSRRRRATCFGAQGGDPLAFDELFARHRAALYRAVARRLGRSLGRRIDPSDVVQEAPRRCPRAAGRVRGRRPMPFRHWFSGRRSSGVVKLRRHASASRRDVGRERPFDGGRLVRRAPVIESLAAGPTPSQQAALRDTGESAACVLERLPELDRAILAMRTFEGPSYEEAGAPAGDRSGRGAEAIRPGLAPPPAPCSSPKG